MIEHIKYDPSDFCICKNNVLIIIKSMSLKHFGKSTKQSFNWLGTRLGNLTMYLTTSTSTVILSAQYNHILILTFLKMKSK